MIDVSIVHARQYLAAICEEGGKFGRSNAYLSGENDDQPELTAVRELLAILAYRDELRADGYLPPDDDHRMKQWGDAMRDAGLPRMAGRVEHPLISEGE